MRRESQMTHQNVNMLLLAVFLFFYARRIKHGTRHALYASIVYPWIIISYLWLFYWVTRQTFDWYDVNGYGYDLLTCFVLIICFVVTGMVWKARRVFDKLDWSLVICFVYCQYLLITRASLTTTTIYPENHDPENHETCKIKVELISQSYPPQKTITWSTSSTLSYSLKPITGCESYSHESYRHMYDGWTTFPRGNCSIPFKQGTCTMGGCKGLVILDNLRNVTHKRPWWNDVYTHEPVIVHNLTTLFVNLDQVEAFSECMIDMKLYRVTWKIHQLTHVEPFIITLLLLGYADYVN